MANHTRVELYAILGTVLDLKSIKMIKELFYQIKMVK